MDLEELKCWICKHYYNDTIHIPRILSTCGHTICQKCINRMIKINSGRFIKCPEDGTIYEDMNFDDFPKNIPLLKLASKSNIPIKKSNSSINSTLIKSSFFNDSSRELNLENATRLVDLNQTNRTIGTKQVCLKHNKPFDIICMDHKCKICANCALFGDHKNHEIINTDEIYTEVFTNAERLFNYYQLVNKEICDHENKEVLEKIARFSREKIECLKEQIDGYCSKLKNHIDLFNKNINKELEEKFSEILKQVRKNKDFPNELKENIENWTFKVQNILDKVTIMSETDEIYFDLIGSKNTHITGLMIKNAEVLINQIKSLKIENNDHIFDAIRDFNIEFQAKYESIFDNLIQLKLPNNMYTHSNKKEPRDYENQDFCLTFGKTKQVISKEMSYLSPQKLEKRIEKVLRESPRKSLISSESTINYLSSTKSNEENTIVNLINNNLFRLDKNDYSYETLLNASEDNSNLKKKDSDLSNILPRACSIDSISQGLSSDKKIFIKNQMKNEVACFNSYEVGDLGAKFISEIMSTKDCIVKELKLSKIKVSNQGAKYIFKAFQMNNSIYSCNLSKNLITDEIIEVVIKCLSKNEVLKVLNLSHNQISPSYVEKLKASCLNRLKLII